MGSEKYQLVSKEEHAQLEADAWAQFQAEEWAARGLKPGDPLDVDGEGRRVRVTTGILATVEVPEGILIVVDDRVAALKGRVADRLKAGIPEDQLPPAQRDKAAPDRDTTKSQPSSGVKKSAIGAGVGLGLGVLLGAAVPNIGPEAGAATGAVLGALAGRMLKR